MDSDEHVKSREDPFPVISTGYNMDALKADIQEEKEEEKIAKHQRRKQRRRWQNNSWLQNHLFQPRAQRQTQVWKRNQRVRRTPQKQRHGAFTEGAREGYTQDIISGEAEI